MSWFTSGKRQPGWLALAVHDDRIDLAHVKRTIGDRPALARCDSFRREGSHVETLTRLRKELKLDQYRCTTLLGADHYQLHQIEAPSVPVNEMKGAVRWRVKDIIDYPLESATVDVLQIPVDPQAATSHPTVYAVTARNDAIESCIRPFQGSQITLDAIDIAELAQRNLAALFEPEQQGVAMLAFYAGDGILTFTRGGELYVSRRIEIPLAELMATDDAQREEHLGRIALAVQRSLDHFEREYPYVPLARLLIAPLPRDIGLQEYLTSNIDGTVEAVDLAAVIDFSAVPELRPVEQQSRYLSMIGAALRGEEAAAA